MAEKGKRESKKEQKIKEENIKKLDEQIKENKKIPKDYKKKINKQLMINIITLIVMIIYLASLNVSSLYLDTKVYLKSLKILSVVLATISVVYFEFSYRKDNEKLFLYGAEVLFLAVTSLFSIYGYYIYFTKFNKILLVITIAFAVYYFIKILVVRSRMKKQYYKEQNDISDIVQR